MSTVVPPFQNTFDANVIAPIVSTFISTQFPEFVREGSPAFVAFLQAYYEFLEQQVLPTPNGSSVVYNAKNLLNYKDVDTTLDSFIQYFINDFLPYFPNDVVLDERKLIKIARQFYIQKGTPQSIQFLFQVLYGKQADIYFPKNNILKLSDGKWTQPQALRLLLDTQNLNFPVQELVQRIGVGSNSGAQCVIESVNKVVDPNLGFEIVEVYVSQVTQPFDDLENLIINYGTDATGNALIFEEKIIAALSNIIIDPHNQGLLYVTGDPVVLTNGLEPNDPSAQKAIAYVGNVTTGSVTSINVVFGGYDYRQNPNTIVTFVAAPGDNGVGAQAIVSSLDTANEIFVNVNTDCIEFHANVVIGSPGAANQWGFTNCSYTNANTQIGQALTYANLQFAPIKTMNVIQGGGGYGKVPSIQTEVVYYTDLTNALIEADDPTANQTFQNIDDLGMFAAVQVLNGGNGYSNTTDKIYTNTAIGYGAAFNFITVGGVITQVIVTNRGAGYIGLPNVGLYIANSTNSHNVSAGSGANLKPYGFGQGANVTLGVSQIGQILDFNLVNRGFDYIAAPNVSLRIQDVTINPLALNQVPANDVIIYQGTSANSATYTAYVDSLNSTTNVLRLYNYRGGINVFANLVMTLSDNQVINATINTAVSNNVITYGNGLAKANAIFLNGLIQYPGFYLNTDGFLSADQYLQDANTYHNYSYQIIVEKALADYKSVLMKIAHPAGMSMLGIYVVPAVASAYPAPSSNVSYISPLTGTVTPNVYTANLTASGTTFLSEGVNVGDMIIFNTSDTTRRLQSKLITAVGSNTSLNLESNTMFTYDNLVSVTNTSNVIVSVGTDFIGNIAVNDVVLLNVANTLTYSLVLGVGSNNLTVNTVFAHNCANMVMGVQPDIVAASYQIVSGARR
jgi:hypothetical protein